MNHSEMITRRYSFVEEGKRWMLKNFRRFKYAKMTGQKLKTLVTSIEDYRNEPNIWLPGHNAFLFTHG